MCLTVEGLKQAEHLCGKHSVIRQFLSEVLDVDPSIAERDACVFEHCISLESLQSMHRYLESFQPHDREET